MKQLDPISIDFRDRLCRCRVRQRFSRPLECNPNRTPCECLEWASQLFQQLDQAGDVFEVNVRARDQSFTQRVRPCDQLGTLRCFHRFAAELQRLERSAQQQVGLVIGRIQQDGFAKTLDRVLMSALTGVMRRDGDPIVCRTISRLRSRLDPVVQ